MAVKIHSGACELCADYVYIVYAYVREKMILAVAANVNIRGDISTVITVVVMKKKRINKQTGSGLLAHERDRDIKYRTCVNGCRELHPTSFLATFCFCLQTADREQSCTRLERDAAGVQI